MAPRTARRTAIISTNPTTPGDHGVPVRKTLADLTDVGSVDLIDHDDRVLLVLSGAVDVVLTRELTDAAHAAVEAGKPVEVDTRGVTFIDSSTVATLAWLASRTDGQLRMIDPPDVVKFVLEVTRVGEIVDLVDDQGNPLPAE